MLKKNKKSKEGNEVDGVVREVKSGRNERVVKGEKLGMRRRREGVGE